jgi:hypothetical protein
VYKEKYNFLKRLRLSSNHFYNKPRQEDKIDIKAEYDRLLKLKMDAVKCVEQNRRFNLDDDSFLTSGGSQEMPKINHNLRAHLENYDKERWKLRKMAKNELELMKSLRKKSLSK